MFVVAKYFMVAVATCYKFGVAKSHMFTLAKSIYKFKRVTAVWLFVWVCGSV